MTPWVSFVATVCALALIAVCLIGLAALVFFAPPPAPRMPEIDAEDLAAIAYFQALAPVTKAECKLLEGKDAL